jgi:hypothetical protein
MNHITRQMAAAVLNQLQSPFDAHTVERRVLQLHTEATANELLEFRRTGDPLHQFSAAFARWIDNEFHGQIRQSHKVVSENLGGEQSQNQEWEKVNPATPIT